MQNLTFSFIHKDVVCPSLIVMSPLLVGDLWKPRVLVFLDCFLLFWVFLKEPNPILILKAQKEVSYGCQCYTIKGEFSVAAEMSTRLIALVNIWEGYLYKNVYYNNKVV